MEAHNFYPVFPKFLVGKQIALTDAVGPGAVLGVLLHVVLVAVSPSVGRFGVVAVPVF